MNAALVDSDESRESLKFSTILEINNIPNLTVEHVIHRHGLTESEARHVESALIDAYPGLTNLIRGHKVDLGSAHCEQLLLKYGAIELKELYHDLLAINIYRSSQEGRSNYDAVRYAWNINLKNASKVTLVIAHKSGLIVGAYSNIKWLAATTENFPGFSEMPGRYGFTADEANHDLLQLYVGKRLPESLFPRGSQQSVRYLKAGVFTE